MIEDFEFEEIEETLDITEADLQEVDKSCEEKSKIEPRPISPVFSPMDGEKKKSAPLGGRQYE